MVLIEEFIKFILKSDDFIVLFLFLKLEFLEKSIVFLVIDILFEWVLLLFFYDLFVFDELLDFFVHFLFFILIEIDTINTVLDDFFVPMVIFDDFDDLLFLIRTDNGEDLTEDHFDEGRVVVDKLILEFCLIQRGLFSGFRLILIFIRKLRFLL